MFSKNNKSNKPQAPTKPALPPAPPSIVSRDLSIVGDLISEGEIQVDGTVNGDIRTNVLIIGESARIKGEVVAETVRIMGSVDGQIKAKVVKLAATAHVVGDILHEDLSIETGAFLEGHCKRMTMPDDILHPEKPRTATLGAADALAQKATQPSVVPNKGTPVPAK